MKRAFKEKPEYVFHLTAHFANQNSVDISETEKEVIIKANLPGYKKEDVNTEAYENKILISTKKKKEKVEQKEDFYRRERSAREDRRVLSLPANTKPEKAKLEFLEGVLTITLPKKEEAKKKKKKLI